MHMEFLLDYVLAESRGSFASMNSTPGPETPLSLTRTRKRRNSAMVPVPAKPRYILRRSLPAWNSARKGIRHAAVTFAPHPPGVPRRSRSFWIVKAGDECFFSFRRAKTPGACVLCDSVLTHGRREVVGIGWDPNLNTPFMKLYSIQ